MDEYVIPDNMKKYLDDTGGEYQVPERLKHHFETETVKTNLTDEEKGSSLWSRLSNIISQNKDQDKRDKVNVGVKDLLETSWREGGAAFPTKVGAGLASFFPPDVAAKTIEQNEWFQKFFPGREIPQLSRWLSRKSEEMMPTPEMGQAVSEKYPIAKPALTMAAELPTYALLAAAPEAAGATPAAIGGATGAMTGYSRSLGKGLEESLPAIGEETLGGMAFGKLASKLGLETSPEKKEALDFFKKYQGQPKPMNFKAKDTVITGEPQVEAPLSPEISPINQPTIAQPQMGAGRLTGKVVETEAFRPDKIDSAESVEKIITGTAQKAGQFAEQRRSVSDKDIIELADLVNVTPESLMESKPGSVANAETTFKSRQVINNLAQDLSDTLKGIDTATITPEQRTVIKNKYLRLQGVMNTVAGWRTEASHAFRQYKIPASESENYVMDGLINDLKKVDADAAGNIEAFAKGSKQITDPTLGDKAWHLWYASILSGPSTHAKNILGNISSIFSETARTALTAPQELPSTIGGLFRGLVEGTKQAGKVLKTGETNKFERLGIKPIVFKGKASFLNAADYVGRALSGVDALFRSGAKGMEMGPLARLEAKNLGLTGKALRIKAQELLRNPTPEMMEQVNQFGARAIFDQEPTGVLGFLSKNISNMITGMQKHPSYGVKAAGAVGRTIIPFTRVIANVVNNGLDLTPIGMARAAGMKLAKVGTSRQQYQQLGRGVLGTVGMTYLASLAEDGKVTGHGPNDTEKRRQLMDAGWRPNSIKIGDKFYPYNNWGPFAIPIGLVGNYYDSVKYGNLSEKDAISRLSISALGALQTITDASFLSNVSELIKAIQEPQASGNFAKRWIAQQGTSIVPNLYKQIYKMFNPTVYEANTLFEQIKKSASIPVGLKPQLTVFGEPVIGERISGLYPSPETTDPVKKFLIDSGLYVPSFRKTTKVLHKGEKESKQVTPEELYKLKELYGPEIKESLDKELPRLQKIKNQDILQMIIDKIAGMQKEAAKARLR